MASCHVELTFSLIESTLSPIISLCFLPPPIRRFSIGATNIVANQDILVYLQAQIAPAGSGRRPCPWKCWQSSCVVKRHHRIDDGRWRHIQPSLYSISTFGLCCCGGQHSSDSLPLFPLSIKFVLEPTLRWHYSCCYREKD